MRGSRGLGVGLALVALPVLAAAARAEPLARARFTTSDAQVLARAWTARGLDVVEGSVTPRTLEVIASRAALERLRAPGTSMELLEVGHPRAPGGDSPLLALDEPVSVPSDYESYEAITSHAAALCARFPSICQVVDLTATLGAPPTFEGRHIQGVKLSDNVALDEDEPSVLLVAAHHARELGTPVVALAALAHLIDGYGSDPQVTAAVDGNQIWIVPVWNPDGYAYVFSTDNLWRKNRRVFDGAVGVDLNRNYPFGWDAACFAGSLPADDTYKGPGAASEAETQTMALLAGQQRFAKVLDFHSAGREVVTGYPCEADPRAAFRMAEAVTLSNLAGYGGAARLPASEGQHEQFEAAAFGAHAFLVEVGEQFQPEFAASVAEAEQVWPAIAWMLQRPISVEGHVTDACTGAPVAANITVVDLPFASGESDASGGAFGRYHVFLPAGNHALRFEAPGYRTVTSSIVVTDDAPVILPIALTPTARCASDAGVSGDGRALAPRRSGSLATARDARSMDDGCDCNAGASTTAGWSWLLALAWLAPGRRRRH